VLAFRRMGMRATTIRMGDDLWRLLEDEAARQGVSAAQLIRDATLLRLGHLAAERGDASARLTLQQLARQAIAEREGSADTSVALGRPERLAAVRRSGLVDAAKDPALEALVQVCAKLLGVPTVLISLVEPDRQFFAASCGLGQPWSDARQTGLSHSFCQHVVASRQPFVVGDARAHPRVRDNLAIRDLGVIAYAGVPLTTSDDEILGSFCAIDHVPREWTRDDLRTLTGFAESVIAHIETGAQRADGPA
jgi:hypothetical protein